MATIVIRVLKYFPKEEAETILRSLGKQIKYLPTTNSFSISGDVKMIETQILQYPWVEYYTILRSEPAPILKRDEIPRE
jgi:hypothetical protein